MLPLLDPVLVQTSLGNCWIAPSSNICSNLGCCQAQHRVVLVPVACCGTKDVPYQQQRGCLWSGRCRSCCILAAVRSGCCSGRLAWPVCPREERSRQELRRVCLAAGCRLAQCEEPGSLLKAPDLRYGPHNVLDSCIPLTSDHKGLRACEGQHLQHTILLPCSSTHGFQTPANGLQPSNAGSGACRANGNGLHTQAHTFTEDRLDQHGTAQRKHPA